MPTFIAEMVIMIALWCGEPINPALAGHLEVRTTITPAQVQACRTALLDCLTLTSANWTKTKVTACLSQARTY